MKKFLILILTLSMIAAAFMGCTQKPSFGASSADTNENGLRDDVELKIMKSIYGKREDFDPKDIRVTYYGSYKDIVLFDANHIGSIGLTKPYTEIVAGIEFYFSSTSKAILAWYNKKHYKLIDLYELGVLNDDDIKEIHAIYINYKETIKGKIN